MAAQAAAQAARAAARAARLAAFDDLPAHVQRELKQRGKAGGEMRAFFLVCSKDTYQFRTANPQGPREPLTQWTTWHGLLPDPKDMFKRRLWRRVQQLIQQPGGLKVFILRRADKRPRTPAQIVAVASVVGWQRSSLQQVGRQWGRDWRRKHQYATPRQYVCLQLAGVTELDPPRHLLQEAQQVAEQLGIPWVPAARDPDDTKHMPHAIICEYRGTKDAISGVSQLYRTNEEGQIGLPKASWPVMNRVYEHCVQQLGPLL